MIVGVTDRLADQERKSCHPANSIYFDGSFGVINYREKGKQRQKKTGEKLLEGTKIRVEVTGCNISFNLTYQGKQRTCSVESDILNDPLRHFVPFLQMMHIGDTAELSL
jgi:hypothetical protein